MILCIFGSMGAGSMVNSGPYIALVDMNKCDSKQASSGAAGATNYATAVLDVTRASTATHDRQGLAVDDGSRERSECVRSSVCN